MLTAVLCVAALAAGIAGTWSPCGLSMIWTLSPVDHDHGARRARSGALALTAGCIAGGTGLFAGVAALGGALWSDARVTAGTVALAAALLDLRGLPVLPQVRRQVPEPWRRHAPLEIAAGAYGVLLGLGFTTFVMSYALWGLALVAMLVADPALGIPLGAAFGLGRALPIAVLAPAGDARWALAAQERMAQRPAVLRTVRAAAGALLGAAGIALLAAPAGAAPRLVTTGFGLSADGTTIAFQRAGADGLDSFVKDLGGGAVVQVPGRLVAVGGGLRAWVEGDTLSIAPVALDAAAQHTMNLPPGVDAIAVDARWVAYRVSADLAAGRTSDTLYAALVDGSAPPLLVATVSAPAQLGRPSLDGDRIAFHVASRAGSRILVRNLATGSTRTIRRRGAQLLFPALSDGRLAYVEVTACRQRLVLVQRGHPVTLTQRFTHVLRDSGYADGAARIGRSPKHCLGPQRQAAGNGMFWDTALTPTAAYLAVVDAVAPRREPYVLVVGR